MAPVTTFQLSYHLVRSRRFQQGSMFSQAPSTAVRAWSHTRSSGRECGIPAKFWFIDWAVHCQQA